jgi:hypothetical protein
MEMHTTNMQLPFLHATTPVSPSANTARHTPLHGTAWDSSLIHRAMSMLSRCDGCALELGPVAIDVRCELFASLH